MTTFSAEDVRHEFPILEHRNYLNSCSLGALSHRAEAYLDEFRQQWHAMGASAWFQGKAGAAGSDALAETGQGFGNYLITLGIVETVALFVMVVIQGSF